MYKRIISILIALTIMLYPLTALGINEVPPHEAALAAIVNVVATPSTQAAGNIQNVSVQVSTSNVSNSTSITATLMSSDGTTPIAGISIASGTVTSNAATLTLSIPAVIGAGSYKIKASIDSLNISKTEDYTITQGAQPNISTVSAAPTSHIAGTQQVITVSINTANVSNTPAVDATIQLVNEAGTPVPGVSTVIGTIVNNSAEVNLTIPATIVAGSYKLKVTVASVTNSNTVYTINQQSSTPDIVQVLLSSLRQNVGESKTINVTVNTQQVPNGTAVILTLVDSQGQPVQGVQTVSSTINSNTGTAQFTIPASSTIVSYAINASLTVDSSEKTKLSSTFTVIQPNITVSSVSTGNASLIAGSISGNMVISGANFSAIPENNQIRIINSTTQAEIAATPSASTGTTITAAIPSSLTAGTYNVKVTVNGKYATKGSALEITAPEQTGNTGNTGNIGGSTGGNTGGSIGGLSGGASGGYVIPTPTPTPSSTPEPTSEPTVQQTVKDITAQTIAIKNETNSTEAKEIVVTLIKEMAADIRTLKDKGESTITITNALKEAADAAIDKVNTETITATKSGNSSKIVIDAAQAAKLLSKMDAIASTAKEINTQFSSSKVEAEVEAVLEIKAKTDKGIKALEAQLPSSLLKAAASKKIDKISIDTGVATISIAPDSIAATTGNILLSAATVDNKNLPANIKKVVGSNAVFDFNATADNKKISRFNKLVKVTVPFTLTTKQDAEKITVFFVNDKGVLENKTGFYDAATKSVSFTTDHFSKYVVKENKITFSDLKADNPNKKYIEVMAAKGIMGASLGNKFSPDSYITRGELTQVLVNAFKIGNISDKTLKTKFRDVKAKDKYFGAIALVERAGLMICNKDGTFKPNDKVSKKEIAVILTKAAKQYNVSILPIQPDQLITYSNNITRSDLAKIMYMLLK